MKSFNFIISIVCLLLLLASCSDDVVNPPDKTECKLISYTDSLNYYYEVEYKDDQVSTLNYYRYKDDEVQDLVRRIKINRNIFNEIVDITSTDNDGNINFIDSVFRNQRGLMYEIVTFNSVGDYVEKTVRLFDKLNQTKEEINYKYDGSWNKNTKTVYEYDSKGRIVERNYEQFNSNGSRMEHSVYEYDDMKNINKYVDLFTVFDTNNFLKITTTYTSRDGIETVTTKNYMYEYNEEGYPTKVESTSSSNENVTVRYNTIVCN